MEILGWIVFGAIAGWIASAVMGRQGSGCFVNIALGLVGALVGGMLFRLLSGGFSYEEHNVFVSMIVAVIGAVIVLAIWNALSARR
jgi:uncharacterized membrane protein YeaQ/YmgE (transglycosylase-associated protein family)